MLNKYGKILIGICFLSWVLILSGAILIFEEKECDSYDFASIPAVPRSVIGNQTGSITDDTALPYIVTNRSFPSYMFTSTEPYIVKEPAGWIPVVAIINFSIWMMIIVVFRNKIKK